jgi:hypothetical protein
MYVAREEDYVRGLGHGYEGKKLGLSAGKSEETFRNFVV